MDVRVVHHHKIFIKQVLWIHLEFIYHSLVHLTLLRSLFVFHVFFKIANHKRLHRFLLGWVVLVGGDQLFRAEPYSMVPYLCIIFPLVALHVSYDPRFQVAKVTVEALVES